MDGRLDENPHSQRGLTHVIDPEDRRPLCDENARCTGIHGMVSLRDFGHATCATCVALAGAMMEMAGSNELGELAGESDQGLAAA